MGLITLLLVVAFTALYLSKSLEKKPEMLVRVTEKITPHIDQVALYGAAYGVVAAVLTLIMHYNTVEGMLARLASDVLICAMALPFIFDQLAAKYRGKVNVVILDELRNLVGWVSRNEKIVGYAGGVCSLMLFAVLFK